MTGGPAQTYFTETTPATAFFSEVGAMYMEGNWNLPQLMENYPEMRGKWDIAKLPKCPDPMSGDGRATMSNGLCYSTGAHGKQLEAALDMIKFYLFYRESFVAGNRGSGSAIAVWTVLIIGIATVFQFIGQKKWVNYEV